MLESYARNIRNVPLRIIDDNKKLFRFFTVFGLFPIYYKDGQFICHNKILLFTRIIWFLWHLAGIACIMSVYLSMKNETTNIINVGNEPETANSRTTDLVNKIIGDDNDVDDDDDDDDSVTRNTELPESVTSKMSSDESINSANYDKEKKKNTKKMEKDKLNRYLVYALGVLMFILVDPVQTIILKRTFNFMPKILKEIKYLESINLGSYSSQRNFNMSKIGPNKKNKKETKSAESSFTESTTNICVSDEPESKHIKDQDANLYDQDQAEIEIFSKYYNMLRYTIFGITMLVFVILFVIGFIVSLLPHENSVRHDIVDEWKFFGSIFYLVFPCLTTWFCVVFISYQREMFQVLNELPNDMYINEDYIKNIGEYFETMQNISKMLIDKIYRFTFGINFALFVIIGSISTFELIQGVGAIADEDLDTEFGDIVYVFPILICIFHIYISCQHSSNIMTGQHLKLRYKLKGLMTKLLVDKIEISKENEKKFKRVELLYKNLKDFSPQPEVYGGFKVDFKMFTGMMIFMLTYARIFYGYNPAKAEI